MIMPILPLEIVNIILKKAAHKGLISLKMYH